MSSIRGSYLPPLRQPRAWMVTLISFLKQIEPAVGQVDFIRFVHLGHTGVGRGILHIFSVYIKIIRAAEVVLRTGAANGGEFLVAIQVKLDFAFAPPALPPQPF